MNFLQFSPDGKWIASAGEDGLIKVSFDDTFVFCFNYKQLK